MDENKSCSMSRKEFLQKSSKGLLSLGLLSRNPISTLDSRGTRAIGSPEYRTLGRTGLKVTVVGFGATRTLDPVLVRRALDSGSNYIDTGRTYSNGQNEVMLGKVLKGMRKDIVIQTKITLRLRGLKERLETAEGSKTTRSLMEKSLHESLKALQTDYIDVMLLHQADIPEMVRHETIMEFFQEVKKEGKIRAHGFSTHAVELETFRAANQSGFYDVIMTTYNHKGSYIHSQSGNYSEWDQSALEVELKKAKKHNTGIVAMKTCSAGPYAFENEDKPSYRSALRWVASHDTIHTMAVAMGNFDEIEEDIQAIVA